ncbi:hypothetical protein PG991_010695 [Apiospora marii]|uniref:Cupin 2 conserved barrel domain-containing protein n=1 Tax=Apiospora marii TaxID=335849 RepID=A0ABR1RC37_9PEZI
MDQNQDSELVISAFDGAIVVHRVRDATRAFYYDITFDLSHPRLIQLASADKPPMHFHPYQEEYIQVLSGTLGVEVEKAAYRLRPEDGELCVAPWANHRLYPLTLVAQGAPDGDRQDEIESSADETAPPPQPALRTTRFLLSAQKSAVAFRLDDNFFQNWYGYQDEVVMSGRKLDMIQVMNMFDAGGSYLTLPSWIPFSKRLAQIVGIVVGRWIGGLLGYQPFHRKWTTDWTLASEKLETSWFLRRFSDRAKFA